MDIRITNYRAKFVKRYFTIFIFIGKNNSLIDDLLKLRIFQIVADHHFQHLQSTDMDRKKKLRKKKKERKKKTNVLILSVAM